jgi:hypothetical protein
MLGWAMGVLGGAACRAGEAGWSETVVDPAALHFPEGKWGTCVNGQTFQQEALVSYKGWQYAAYFAEGGKPCLGRRRLPGGPWEILRFEDYTMPAHNDTHNVAVVGICPADGTLHLAYDHHVSALHYRRSVPGLAEQPEKFAWTPEQFGPTTAQLEPGRPVSDVTYPMFFPVPDGRLQFLYRTGSSGDGDWHLAEYAGEAGWKKIGLLLSGKGTYQGSVSRCAYPNPLRYGPGGRLHLTWSWRERPPGQPFDLRTNHDLCYAYSDDSGRTWRNGEGDPVARLEGEEPGQPIAVDSPGTVAREIPFLWGQMNTTTQAVDREGFVHVIGWQNPPEAAQSSLDLNEWRYFHHWGKAGEKWRTDPLPFHGRKPQIFTADSGAAYAVYLQGEDANYHGKSDPGGRLHIAFLPPGKSPEWREIFRSEREFMGEPLLDQATFSSHGFLSVYVQEKSEAGKPGALRVLDFSREFLEGKRAPGI